MKIKIAEKLKPFSHEAGTSLLLPGTELRLQIFPALIRVVDFTDITLDVRGPLQGFTVELDLEKGCIRVWDNGTLDYVIWASGELFITSKRELKMTCSSGYHLHKVNETTTAIAKNRPSAAAFIPWGDKPALSLGCHKAQDWPLIKRRLDLKEILPHWHRLGYALSSPGERPKGGTIALLDKCKESGKMEMEEVLTHLFQAGFEGILSPRLTDDEHQGFQLPPSQGGSPLWLLSEGAALIQSLFFQCDENSITLLPKLPPAFHAGRFINLKVEGIGVFHFEWSKKQLKKLIFLSNSSKMLHFHWQKLIKSCRLRLSLQDRGEKIENSVSVNVEAERTYYFDRFEK